MCCAWSMPLAVPLLIFGIQSPVQAQQANRAPPSVVTDVTACRTIAEPSQRLKCFDSAVATLEDAQESNELVILDKLTIKETRRGLFGFKLPSLNVFARSDVAEAEIEQIEGRLKSAERDGFGMYRFVLEDGAVWQQTDGRVRPGTKAGSPVVIRQAALGSFIMKINNQPGIRVKRVG